MQVSYTALENSGNGSANGSKPKTLNFTFDTDEGPRADTSIEALAKLKPVFHAHGVVTAGNSSQMSDGAAAAVVMSAERARELGPEAAGAFCCVCDCRSPPEEMGMGLCLRFRKRSRSPD